MTYAFKVKRCCARHEVLPAVTMKNIVFLEYDVIESVKKIIFLDIGKYLVAYTT
jgi:hypothetical protein